MGARLAAEVAIVTGSTSGLGREIARVFAEESCAVAVTGRDRERGEATAAAIRRDAAEVEFFAADITDSAACGRLVDAVVRRFGRLTVLVNNAVADSRAAADAGVAELEPAALERILEVNLVAAATLCGFAIPRMLDAGHGSIVNVSSRAAELGTPGHAAYTMSKAGLDALSRSITADYARSGIRSNTVQPGYVLHEQRDAQLSEERRERLQAMQLTRLATATDVARAALFLASSEAEVITGTTLRVDGGSTVVRARALG